MSQPVAFPLGNTVCPTLGGLLSALGGKVRPVPGETWFALCQLVMSQPAAFPSGNTVCPAPGGLLSALGGRVRPVPGETRFALCQLVLPLQSELTVQISP